MAKPKGSKDSTKPRTQKIDINTFVKEMAARQTALLQTMVQQIQEGEISVTDDEQTERYIEAIVGDWCECDEPDLEQHMVMCATIFYWALLDEAFVTARGANDNSRPSYGATNRDLAIEALKTIRAIWGRS